MYGGSGFHAPSSVRSLRRGGEGKEEKREDKNAGKCIVNILFICFLPPPAIASLWVSVLVTGGRCTVPEIILACKRRGTNHGVGASYSTVRGTNCVAKCASG